MPVAEVARRRHDDDDLWAAERDPPRRDRVDGRPVGRGDVDTGVERRAAALADSWIAEERAHRVLPVERLERPGVGRAVGHD